jgi:hypothetical protein
MKDIRRGLIALRDEELRAAAEGLLSKDGADISERLRRIEAADRLLSHIKPPSHTRAVAATIAVACVVAGGLAWALPVPKASVTLEAFTEAVSLRLAEPWTWTGDVALGSGPLRIEGWDRVSAPMVGIDMASPNGEAWLESQDAELRLTTLALGPGGQVSLVRYGRGAVDVFAVDAPVKAQLAVSGKTRLRVGDGLDKTDERQLAATVPETFGVSSRARASNPARLTLRTERWSLHGLNINGMSLGRQAVLNPGMVRFESALVGGKVIVNGTGAVHQIHPGERLTLRGVRGRVAELVVADRIELRFEGVVDQVLLGSEGFERNLAPSVLSYLYHSKPLSFFWSAVVFLWGASWSTRRLWQHPAD